MFKYTPGEKYSPITRAHLSTQTSRINDGGWINSKTPYRCTPVNERMHIILSHIHFIFKYKYYVKWWNMIAHWTVLTHFTTCNYVIPYNIPYCILLYISCYVYVYIVLRSKRTESHRNVCVRHHWIRLRYTDLRYARNIRVSQLCDRNSFADLLNNNVNASVHFKERRVHG